MIFIRVYLFEEQIVLLTYFYNQKLILLLLSVPCQKRPDIIQLFLFSSAQHIDDVLILFRITLIIAGR